MTEQDHPWASNGEAACMECGEVGHLARNCPTLPEPGPELTNVAELAAAHSRYLASGGHLRTIPERVSAEQCHEWATRIRATLPPPGTIRTAESTNAGTIVYGQELARRQLAESRASRLPEAANERPVETVELPPEDDGFPF